MPVYNVYFSKVISKVAAIEADNAAEASEILQDTLLEEDFEDVGETIEEYVEVDDVDEEA